MLPSNGHIQDWGRLLSLLSQNWREFKRWKVFLRWQSQLQFEDWLSWECSRVAYLHAQSQIWKKELKDLQNGKLLGAVVVRGLVQLQPIQNCRNGKPQVVKRSSTPQCNSRSQPSKCQNWKIEYQEDNPIHGCETARADAPVRKKSRELFGQWEMVGINVNLVRIAYTTLHWPQLLHVCYRIEVCPFIIDVRHSSVHWTETVTLHLRPGTFIRFQKIIKCSLQMFLIDNRL